MRYHRRPHTIQEIGVSQTTLVFNGVPETGAVRLRYRRRYLPTSYSDISKSCERSWKQFRNNQWKNN